MLRALAAVVLLAVATAPATHEPGGVPAPPPPADGRWIMESVALRPVPAASSEDRIVVDATENVTVRGFALTAAGGSVGRVRAAAFPDKEGSLTIGTASIPTVAYERIAWPDFSLTLYQGIATDGRDLHVAWLYCSSDQLTGVFHESAIEHALAWSQHFGACTSKASLSSTSQASLPAIDMPYPPLVGGFSIHGPSIDLEGDSPGRIVLDGRELVLLPFEVVDCTELCGAIPGWWELHALLHDPIGKRVTFAILYLFPEDAGRVAMHYGVTLPGLVEVSSRDYEASWTAP